jgi:hypothetical protein
MTSWKMTSLESSGSLGAGQQAKSRWTVVAIDAEMRMGRADAAFCIVGKAPVMSSRVVTAGVEDSAAKTAMASPWPLVSLGAAGLVATVFGFETVNASKTRGHISAKPLTKSLGAPPFRSP